MLKLNSSIKVKREIEDFQLCIGQIKSKKKRLEFEKLLQELKNYIDLIDNTHSLEYSGYVKPNIIKDNIEAIIIIRNKFYQLKKDLN